MSNVVATLREAVIRRIALPSRSEDATAEDEGRAGRAAARMLGVVLLTSALLWLLLLGSVALFVWR